MRFAGTSTFRLLIKLLLTSGILIGCYWLIREQLNTLDIGSMRRAIEIVSVRQLTIAAIATAGSYLSLTMLERILFHSAGTPMRWRRVLLGSFIANSVSASIGLVMASSTFLRMRIYSHWSVAARDALYVSLGFSAAISLSGLLGAGLAILLNLHNGQRILGLGTVQLVGLALLLALPAAAFVAIAGGRELNWRQLRFVIPTRKQRLALIGVALADWLWVSCTLFALTGLAITAYPLFLVQFIFGWLFGAMVGMPAGAGAVDVTMIRSFGNDTNVAQLAAALLLFRLIYFAIPALAALVLLAITEVKNR